MPTVLCKVEAIYPFESNDPDSLVFQKGDYIDVYRKLPSGWWNGKCNGNRGWFPSNFVEIIQEELDYYDSAERDIPSATTNRLFNQIQGQRSPEKFFNGHTNSFLKNELTYKKLFDQTRSIINRLTLVTKSLDYDNYAKHVIHVTKSIMISTGSIIHAPSEVLEEQRQVVVTTLSELVMSAYSKSVAKLYLASQDLLWAIQHFLHLCQENDLNLLAIDPVFCLSPDWSFEKTVPDHCLDSDLIFHLESQCQSIQHSVTLFINSLDQSLNRRAVKDSLLFRYRHLLVQNHLFLSTLDALNLSDIRSSLLDDLSITKQQLYSGLSLLFITIQWILDESITTETVLNKTREVLESISKDAQPICKILLDLLIEQEKYKSGETLSTTHSFKSMSSQNYMYSDSLKSPTTNDYGWLVKYDYPENDITFGNYAEVISGTLPALVERVTLHDQLDTVYNSIFLLTYRTFCTPAELIDQLDSRYHIQPPPGLTVEAFEVWKRVKQRPIQLRVCNIIKYLIDHDCDNCEVDVLDRLLVFAERSLSYHFESLSKRIQISIIKLKDSDRIQRFVHTHSSDPPTPILPRRLTSLLDISPLEMARQLTLIEFKTFQSIHHVEWLNMSVVQSDEITLWVSYELTQHPPGSRKRRAMYKYWLTVARKCRQLNNLQSCMAILSAMGHCKTDHNYHTLIETIMLPSIPIIDLFLQDLKRIALEPDFLGEQINFKKRTELAEIIHQTKHFQSTDYVLCPVQRIQEFISDCMSRPYHELHPKDEMEDKLARISQELGFI